eukprot:scaffold5380_cov91-Cyclotella_meneghiniana.AAC.2
MAVHMPMLCQTRHPGTQTSQRSSQSQQPYRPSSAIASSIRLATRWIQPPLSQHRICGAELHHMMAVAFAIKRPRQHDRSSR